MVRAYIPLLVEETTNVYYGEGREGRRPFIAGGGKQFWGLREDLCGRTFLVDRRIAVCLATMTLYLTA